MAMVTINMGRHDAMLMNGCPSVDHMTSMLRSHSALHARRRGAYAGYGEIAATRHDADLELMARDIVGVVTERIGAEPRKHALTIGRNIDATPGYDMLGSQVEYDGLKSYDDGSSHFSVPMKWTSPHALRRIRTTRLGWSIMEHLQPNWRNAMTERLNVAWRKGGVVLDLAHAGARATSKTMVDVTVTGNVDEIAIGQNYVTVGKLFPDTVHQAVKGMDAGEALGHPCLRRAGVIRDVRRSNTKTTFLFDGDDVVFEDLAPDNPS